MKRNILEISYGLDISDSDGRKGYWNADVKSHDDTLSLQGFVAEVILDLALSISKSLRFSYGTE